MVEPRSSASKGLSGHDCCPSPAPPVPPALGGAALPLDAKGLLEGCFAGSWSGTFFGSFAQRRVGGGCNGFSSGSLVHPAFNAASLRASKCSRNFASLRRGTGRGLV